jgi:putative transposase
VEAIQEARGKYDFALWAYVIMPEHVHLLIWPRRPDYRIEHILAALKRPVSAKAKKHLTETGNQKWLQLLTVREKTRDVFRFWLPGGGWDENICSERAIEEVIDYIHANPVRRGLVDLPTQWFWSSARWYAGDRSGPLEINPLPPL